MLENSTFVFNTLNMTSENSQNVTKFEAFIKDLIATNSLFKITFSKPRHHKPEILNIYVKPSLIKNELLYSFTYRYKTRNEVKNYTKVEFSEMFPQLLGVLFFNAVVFTNNLELTLLQSKKGQSSLVSKNVNGALTINILHDHQKQRVISSKREWLVDLGLAGRDGKIFDKSQDKYRQINKYIDILGNILTDIQSDKVISIADMGCGKGYLTFALYDFLVNQKNMGCTMTGFEIREDIVSFCNSIALKNDFKGLNFEQKSIDTTEFSEIDVVIALHACDIATDMAIAKGIQSNAKYIVVAPCCHKQVRLVMRHNNELSPVLKHGILEERQAELITDGIRALIMEAYGYKTQVFEFVSSDHTAKNIMITGIRKKDKNIAVINKIENIKELFGIEYHYLQKTMNEWENKKV